MKYTAGLDDYRRKSNKRDDTHEWKVRTGLTVALLKEFADSLQEGDMYRLHVEKILVTYGEGENKNDKGIKREWVHGELVKKYPHLALFRIGKSRRETFMYKDLYNMAKECDRL